VGNPGVISLSIVTDDEPGPTCQGASGATGEGGAAPELAPASAGMLTEAGGASEAGGAAGAPAEVAAAGAPAEAAGAGAIAHVDGDDLPSASVAHAVVVLDHISWQPCNGAGPTTVHGPFIVNLVGDLIPERTKPQIPSVVEPEGGFCGLEAPLTAAEAPAELAGRSLFFDGTRSDGTLFVLYANVQATLRVKRHGSIVWSASETPSVLWAFRPRRWLSRMAIDQATPMPWDGADFKVVIDLNRHPVLLDALRKRLAGKSSLFLDLNKNRMLDDEDRDAIVGDGSDDPD
jgi:hypothetical protein